MGKKVQKKTRASSLNEEGTDLRKKWKKQLDETISVTSPRIKERSSCKTNKDMKKMIEKQRTILEINTTQ
jgi:3-methyladenine DNA glycosylase AlkC